jgi:lysophospholipase L1-like esterase
VRHRSWSLAFGVLCVTAISSVAAQTAAEMKVTGEWQVEVVCRFEKDGAARDVKATLTVKPPEVIEVADERCKALPVFNASAPGWTKGERLAGVRAFECTTRLALDPASVKVRSAGANATVFERGKDYEMDGDWGTLGRLAAGRIGANQPVLFSYRYAKLRIDSVVLTKTGELVLRQGEAHIATPLPPALGEGEARVGNVYLPGRRIKGLTPDCLFPVLETTYPEPAKASPSVAERLVPNTVKKLREGQTLRILAWGDSVTDGGYLKAEDRWQAQFIARLKERFPKAEIELVTQGWGGRNTASFLGAPPGDPHNYQEKVLGAKPDLIVSEFVNDAGLNPKQVEERYGKLLADFKGIGAEWIILTPHYVCMEWMGFSREREVDDDPRPYVKGLREFTAQHQVALADASLRYGRLWRQGIPYTTLMTNTLNHPDVRGMALFAESLLGLFP